MEFIGAIDITPLVIMSLVSAILLLLGQALTTEARKSCAATGLGILMMISGLFINIVIIKSSIDLGIEWQKAKTCAEELSQEE